ncbi:MAG: cell wall metabolism sensor histidine kinase WalK [Anaerolineae bacterium]|nr:cell wall metabolism sensor histidine kinase WalK [Anaerolineae bacterium]
MSWLNSLFHNFQTRFTWKLMASFLIVIVVGVVTLTLAAESVVPTAFNRHMIDMAPMMIGQMRPGMGIAEMQTDLFTSFRAAVTEALLIATTAAMLTAIAVSIFVSRRVVTPIGRMMEVSRYIAAGHYRERVQVTSQDELGQLAHSFNQMAASLEQVEAMRRELIANVAHELRTPLASIKGYMEGLMDGILPLEPSTFQQIYREADRLQRLVNDLQELSRVEAGAFQLNRQTLSMTDLIVRITERLRPQFEEKQMTLQLNLPADLPPVMADEDRLSQVLLNLIGNALQYTPDGGTVTITGPWPHATKRWPDGRQVSASQVIFTISDTGIGIPPEHLPHLFSRFYRVDKSRSRVGGGSGIGLTIVKHLIEAHGGQVWAESRGAGRGSTFGFSLPVA